IGYWLGPWLAEPVRLATAIPVAVPSEALPTEIPTASLEKPAARSAPPPRIHASGWLLLLWGAGALALGGWMIRRNREVYRLLRSAEPASPELLDQLQESAQRIGLARLPELRLTLANHSPAVCGFLKPVVVLPSALARSLSPSALSDILLHELVHIRRRDLWFNLPQSVAQVLWWWNPVVWLANARIRTLREQAVDEQVMVSRHGDPAGYPAALLEVARHCAARPALALGFVGILESRSGLRSRVERLLQTPLPRRAGLGMPGWTVVILAALLALPMAFARRIEGPPVQDHLSGEIASPASPSTRIALQLLEVEKHLASRSNTLSSPDEWRNGIRDSYTRASEQRRLTTKMESLVLPKIEFNDVSLADALTFLEEQTRTWDLVDNGVTFIVAQESTPPTPSVDPASGIALPSDQTAAPLDLVRIRMAEPVRDVRLVDALDWIVRSSETPLRYRLEGTAVIFSRQPQQLDLYTRTFRVDPNLFLQGLRAITGSSASTPPQNGSTDARTLQQSIREFFAAAGVDFPRPTVSPAASAAGPADPNANQKAVYFNDRSGILFVRATLADLDVIETAIQMLNVAPPQVQVEATFIEVNPEAVEGLVLVSDQIEINTSAGSPGNGGVGGGPEFSKPSLTGVMTDVQFRSVMDRLEARTGTTVTAAPKITTLSGRQAQIAVTDEFLPVVNPGTGRTNQVSAGLELNIIPYVRPDNLSISLTVVANIRRLDGGSNPSATTPSPFTSQWVASIEVPDGDTVVLMGDTPAGAADPGTSGGRLLIFITPTIIDPAGNPVNSPSVVPATEK
ncbi:MAG: hypothetical protein J0L84_13005, partial [Verrucomicrobia bacterium]|nr:hypothetical protein [Verrucomicrobiota bacterium]